MPACVTVSPGAVAPGAFPPPSALSDWRQCILCGSLSGEGFFAHLRRASLLLPSIRCHEAAGSDRAAWSPTAECVPTIGLPDASSLSPCPERKATAEKPC